MGLVPASSTVFESDTDLLFAVGSDRSVSHYAETVAHQIGSDLPRIAELDPASARRIIFECV